MSDSWINYGYGICVSNLKIDSVERIEKLLSLAPNCREKVHAWFKAESITNPTVDSYYEYDGMDCNGMTNIICESLYEASGVMFYECDDYNDNDYILYMPSYPWLLRKSEINVTEEQLKDIFMKFCSIITDTVIEPEYQEVKNSG